MYGRTLYSSLLADDFAKNKFNGGCDCSGTRTCVSKSLHSLKARKGVATPIWDVANFATAYCH
jgi:hypothetical protein